MRIFIASVPRKHVSKMVKAASKHMSRNSDARVLDVQYWDMGTRGSQVDIALGRVGERYGTELAKKILDTYNDHPTIRKELAKKKKEEEIAKRKEAFNNIPKNPFMCKLANEAINHLFATRFGTMGGRINGSNEEAEGRRSVDVQSGSSTS